MSLVQGLWGMDNMKTVEYRRHGESRQAIKKRQAGRGIQRQCRITGGRSYMTRFLRIQEGRKTTGGRMMEAGGKRVWLCGSLYYKLREAPVPVHRAALRQCGRILDC